MPGWDDWAQNALTAGSAKNGGATGAVVYCPDTGAIWGKAGDFECSGNLAQYDLKADGKLGPDKALPSVNGAAHMFIRKIEGDQSVNIFKKSQDSFFTTQLPTGRLAVFVKGKPETAVNQVVDYLKK